MEISSTLKATAVAAQHPQDFAIISTEFGLSLRMIFTMLHDGEGFLWSAAKFPTPVTKKKPTALGVLDQIDICTNCTEGCKVWAE